MNTTTANDVIRVATRAYTNGSVKGVRTYLHINCGCRIASSLMGTYSTMDDARRKANELVNGTGDHYRTCSKSNLVKAQALGRDVRHFDDTMRAGASTFNGAGVRDGDVVVVASEGVVAIVVRAAVIAITVKRGHLVGLDTCARTFRDGLYAEIVDRAEAEARAIGATVDPIHAAPADEVPAAEPTPADVVRTDGVTVKADGRGKWIVKRGGDHLGTIFDEGAEMTRGRFAGWSPYAGTPGNTTAFSHDPAEVVESIVQAWPVTVAEVVAETGRPLDVVLAATEAVREEWEADRRRGVLRIAAATGAATKMTRAAADAVRARLAAPAADQAPAEEERGTCRECGQPMPVHGPSGCILHHTSPSDPFAGCEGGWKLPADEASDLPGPTWGTLKGRTAPFRLWGEERDGGFRPAFDRKEVTGEPLVIAEVWTEQRGTARRGRDVNGREVYLYGAATRFWSAPGA
jgi:hypothetical protein